MGNYFWKTDGIERDELQGRPGELVDVWNVNVSASAVIERGMLLAGNTQTGTFAPVTTADTNKIFVIGRDNFVADADHTVTQAYRSGFFNRERIKLGSDSLAIDPFVNELRRQNIQLVSIQDKFNEQY